MINTKVSLKFLMLMVCGFFILQAQATLIFESVTKEGYREVFALRINFADQRKHVVNRFAQTHTRSYNAAGSSVNSVGVYYSLPIGNKSFLIITTEILIRHKELIENTMTKSPCLLSFAKLP